MILGGPRRQGQRLYSHGALGRQLQCAWWWPMAGPPPRRASAWSTTTCARTAGGGVWTTWRRPGEPEWKAHQTPQGRWGSWHSARGGGWRNPPRRTTKGFFPRWRGAASSTEEGADLQGFTSSRAHMLLQEVYGDSPHHNGGTHLTGGVPYDAVWKICWRKLAVKSSRWYSTPPRKVGRQFASVLAA